TDIDLPDGRQHGTGDAADLPGVDRHVAPADHLLALLADDLLEDLLAGPAGGRVGRQEDHADPVAAAAGHVEAEPEALALEKAVRDLAKDAGAIAGFGVTPGGRPVAEAVQNLERLLDDLARLVALNVRDESDAARVALHRRLVEAPSIR